MAQGEALVAGTSRSRSSAFDTKWRGLAPPDPFAPNRLHPAKEDHFKVISYPVLQRHTVMEGGQVGSVISAARFTEMFISEAHKPASCGCRQS